MEEPIHPTSCPVESMIEDPGTAGAQRRIGNRGCTILHSVDGTAHSIGDAVYQEVSVSMMEGNECSAPQIRPQSELRHNDV